MKSTDMSQTITHVTHVFNIQHIWISVLSLYKFSFIWFSALLQCLQCGNVLHIYNTYDKCMFYENTSTKGEISNLGIKNTPCCQHYRASTGTHLAVRSAIWYIHPVITVWTQCEALSSFNSLPTCCTAQFSHLCRKKGHTTYYSISTSTTKSLKVPMHY